MKFIYFFFGIVVGYMALAFVTDLRVDRLRPFITQHAVEEGVKAGILQYKSEYDAGEHLTTAQRKLRDGKIKQYIQKLDQLIGNDFTEVK